MSQREKLADALAKYDAATEEGKLSQKKIDDLFQAAEDIVPHSGLSDMFFYGERERTAEEIVDEALQREALWVEGGDLAVLLHVQYLARSALEDSSVVGFHRDSAARMHEETSEEIARLKSRLN